MLILLSILVSSGITAAVFLYKEKIETELLFESIIKLEEAGYPFIREDLLKAMQESN